MDNKMESVFNTLKEILMEQLNLDEEEVSMEARLVEDLKADSIDKAEIVTNLEDKFNIIVDYDEALTVKTVGDVVKSIVKLL